MAWVIIPKIEEVMEQRRRKIDDFVQKAEKINKQALQSLNKYEKALQKAKNEADILLEQNKIALQESVSKKHTELEDMLNKKIAVAESCTGGGVTSKITSISGASNVLDGSVVSYANEVKERLLGVERSVLDEKGAVSEECALQMAEAILNA